MKHIDIVFDGPPSHHSGRFVEVENDKGASVKIGEWMDRGNGLWALRFNRAALAALDAPVPEDAAVLAERAACCEEIAKITTNYGHTSLGNKIIHRIEMGCHVERKKDKEVQG
jgi:hypothetical protein